MKLKDLRSKKVGTSLQYSARLRDDQQADNYVFTATGSRSLLLRVLRDAEIEISIRPKASEQDANAAMAELAKRANQSLSELAGTLPTIRAKRTPKSPIRSNSIYLSLQRLEGQGTLWTVFLAGLTIPAGANVFFGFPPVFITSGTVFPARGDTDLFLSLNSPFVPPVRASVNPGLAADAVSFAAFPFEFFPFFRLNGFLSSITSFAANGFGFP